jgi:hypothetical protein
MPNSVQQDFRRYATLIEAALPGQIPFHARVETSTSVQVERGTIYPLALRHRTDEASLDRVDRLVRLAAPPQSPEPGSPLPVLGSVAVVDRSGVRRPEYRPLLVYSWLQSFRLFYETLPRMEFGRWDEALRAWCDLLEAELTNTRIPEGALPASRGGAAVEAALAALALFAAGKVFVRDAWTDLASDTFGRLTRGQRDGTGAFFMTTASDSPEVAWYHELALLHAAASYAVQAEDRTVAAAVARATDFHQRETQPDHASSQPWGLFAFIWNPATRPLAEQMLHAATVQSAGAGSGTGAGAGTGVGDDGVALILLADALYCLRLFDGSAGRSNP